MDVEIFLHAWLFMIELAEYCLRCARLWLLAALDVCTWAIRQVLTFAFRKWYAKRCPRCAAPQGAGAHDGNR
jgi:hypothetical protein